MFPESKVTEIYCMADDFCKEFALQQEKYMIEDSKKKHRNNTDTVKVLQTPKLNSKVSFLIVKPQWKDFYIIYDAYQGWLYIQNINNEQEYGWLSVKYQCDNPYTTCY